MGQAKQRGSRDVRVAQSQARQLNEEPINVPCKSCKAPLNGFTLLRHMPAGAAWQKTCECGAITTALVQAADSTLARTFAQVMDIQDEVTGPGKKCSVDFIEKSVDSIETGLIRLG